MLGLGLSLYLEFMVRIYLSPIENTFEFRLDGTKINGENEASC